jgi:hypothetical protein
LVQSRFYVSAGLEYAMTALAYFLDINSQRWLDIPEVIGQRWLDIL